MSSELIIEVLPGRLRASMVSDSQKILARGLFPMEDNQAQTIDQAIKKAQLGLQTKSAPLLILPEADREQGSEAPGSKKPCQITSALARAHYETKFGSFSKPGTYVLFEVGPHIKMVKIEFDKKQPKYKEIDLGPMVANYEKLSEPEPEVATLRNYCTETFFVHRAKQNSKQLYAQTQNGNVEAGDELFVEFGTNLGALVAFVDTLIEPDGIGLTGQAVETFDAWGHAMGKSRNQFQAKKSKNHVVALKDNPDAVAIGGYLYCMKKAD